MGERGGGGARRTVSGGLPALSRSSRLRVATSYQDGREELGSGDLPDLVHGGECGRAGGQGGQGSSCSNLVGHLAGGLFSGRHSRGDPRTPRCGRSHARARHGLRGGNLHPLSPFWSRVGSRAPRALSFVLGFLDSRGTISIGLAMRLSLTPVFYTKTRDKIQSFPANIPKRKFRQPKQTRLFLPAFESRVVQ